MISNNFLSWVRKYEDFDAHPRMCSKGYVRIGFGRNIDQKGITPGEANLLLENDLTLISISLNHNIEWFDCRPTFVKDAIIHLCYIITIEDFLSMDVLIGSLKRLDYTGAAKAILELQEEMLDPFSYSRIKDIALIISEGARNYESAS